jgi:hypothetical protein
MYVHVSIHVYVCYGRKCEHTYGEKPQIHACRTCIHKSVYICMQVMDLAPFMSSAGRGSNNTKYDLFGVLVHKGMVSIRCVCIYTYLHIHWVSLCVYLHIHKYLYTYILYIYIYIYIYIPRWVYLCVYIYTYTYIRIYIYIYTFQASLLSQDRVCNTEQCVWIISMLWNWKDTVNLTPCVALFQDQIKSTISNRYAG